MEKKPFVFSLFLMFFSGLAGGILAEFLWRGKAEAQNPAAVIQAEEFILSRPKTKAGATLTYTNGMPALHLMDEEGIKRVLIGLGNEGNPFITFYDRFNKNERLTLYTGFDGIPYAQLNDKNGTARAALGLDAQGSGALEFFNKNGQSIFTVPKFEGRK